MLMHLREHVPPSPPFLIPRVLVDFSVFARRLENDVKIMNLESVYWGNEECRLGGRRTVQI